MMLRRPDQPLHIGWREWIALPGLGVPAIKAKVDTGARTSALHAWNVEPFHKSGNLWLRFDLHPRQRSQTSAVRCEAEVADERSVRNSGGIAEKRHVIVTMLRLGDDGWDIEISLTKGLEQATGVDVAGRMIEFLERRAVPGRTKTKGKG